MDGELFEKHWMEFGAAGSLAPFVVQYQFFTPALLYVYGRFNDRPIFDFAAQYAGSFRVYHRLFDHEIFRGMETPDGDPAWNRALWAIERSAWPAFEQWMLSITFSDAATRTVIRVGSQDVSAADPLFVDL